jgi:hypothetical protein
MEYETKKEQEMRVKEALATGYMAAMVDMIVEKMDKFIREVEQAERPKRRSQKGFKHGDN